MSEPEGGYLVETFMAVGVRSSFDVRIAFV